MAFEKMFDLRKKKRSKADTEKKSEDVSYYGLNINSQDIIAHNRNTSGIHNELILGKPGGGKTFCGEKETKDEETH